MSDLYYSTLCTEFYDLTKPEAGPREVAFYEKLVQSVKGPILEAMCGSGRLLIPLLRKGYAIEGVDISKEMLESCKRRCGQEVLSCQLYQQSLDGLALPKKYELILIAIGSFQLIQGREKVMKALELLKTHLLPGGSLVLETYVPWDAFKDYIEGSVLAVGSKPIRSERKAISSSGCEIVCKTETTVDFRQQLEISKTTYEKWSQGKKLQTEEEAYVVRWYHRYEMQLLLEKLGFTSIQIIDTSFELNEQAVVYRAFNQL